MPARHHSTLGSPLLPPSCAVREYDQPSGPAVKPVAFTVILSATDDAAGDAAGEAALTAGSALVRVSAPPHLRGAALLLRAEERLRAAGVLPEGRGLSGLRAADGARVVAAEDVHEGEALEAEVCLAASVEAPATLVAGGEATGLWEHEALFEAAAAEPEEQPGATDDDAPIGLASLSEGARAAALFYSPPPNVSGPRRALGRDI